MFMKKSVRKCLSPPWMPLKRTFAAFLCLALLAGCGSGSKSQETAVAAETMAAAAETTASSYNTAQAPAMYMKKQEKIMTTPRLSPVPVPSHLCPPQTGS